MITAILPDTWLQCMEIFNNTVEKNNRNIINSNCRAYGPLVLESGGPVF